MASSSAPPGPSPSNRKRIFLSEREKVLDPKFLLTLAICIAVAFLGINEIAYQGARNAANADFSQQSRQAKLNALTQELFSAQASLRGYLLTDDPRYLRQHLQVSIQLDTSLRNLEARGFTDKRDQSYVQALVDEVTNQIDEMKTALRLHAENRNAALHFLMSAPHAALVQQSAIELSSRLLQYEDQLAHSERERLQTFLRMSRIGIALLTLTALLAFWLYLRQTASRKRINQQNQKRLLRERDALGRLVRQRTASLSELATHLQQVREDERSHLANELHDELGALLTAAKLDIARLKPRIDMKNPEINERLQHMNETLNQVIALKRRIIEDLRPSSLNTLGLNAALDNLTQEFTRQSGLRVQSDHDELEPGNRDLQLTIYRIMQESLNNIIKYAQATKVQTSLHREAGSVTVSIHDDGRGFDLGSVSTSTHGLRGMRHRIEAMGGNMAVQSKPGRGTTIKATLPLNAGSSRQADPDDQDTRDALSRL